MRIFLILLNLLLAGGVVGAVAMLFESAPPEPAAEKRKSATKSPASARPAAGVSASVRTPTEAAAVLLKNNPFSTGRAPASTPWSSRGRGQSELTLVGTYSLGDARGAVILQKTRSARRQMPGMPPIPPGMPAWNNNSDANAQTVQPQQFIRVGETVAGGYTLVEVGADYAVLARNGARTELKLQEASKNQPATTRAPSAQQQRANQFRQFQQMQMMQQMGMMNMMRQMMQMRNQNNRNQRGGGNFGGGQVVGGGSRRGNVSGGLNTGNGLNL